MSKKEQVKTNIETTRSLFLAFLTALFGVCGFMFYQRKELHAYEFIFLGVVALGIAVILCICAVVYNRQQKELKDL